MLWHSAVTEISARHTPETRRRITVSCGLELLTKARMPNPGRDFVVFLRVSSGEEEDT